MSSELPVFTLRIMVRLERTIDFITVTGRNNIPEHSDKFHRKNVGGSVNTTVQKFEDAAPFISTVRPTVYTNPSRKRSFSKNDALQTWGILERWLLVFRVDGKTVWKRSFSNTMTSRKSRDFPVSDPHTVWGRRWQEKWRRETFDTFLGLETSFCKFLRGSVHRALIWKHYVFLKLRPPYVMKIIIGVGSRICLFAELAGTPGMPGLSGVQGMPDGGKNIP